MGCHSKHSRLPCNHCNKLIAEKFKHCNARNLHDSNVFVPREKELVIHSMIRLRLQNKEASSEHDMVLGGGTEKHRCTKVISSGRHSTFAYKKCMLHIFSCSSVIGLHGHPRDSWFFKKGLPGLRMNIVAHECFWQPTSRDSLRLQCNL